MVSPELFVAPRPNAWLMRVMDSVNRVVMLEGIAGLRDVAPFDRLAGLRGVANVRHIDFPEADRSRLAALCGPGKATFITPNHPEFFTDWMIDKEISARAFPKAAFWATHGIVNGLGRWMQRFWLANNLIAQIPGNSAPAREHSIGWALQGHGVLLHPEGAVGWHRDHVAPLMPGAAEMAMEALRQGRAQDPGFEAFLAPVVWKLAFDRDVSAELHDECAYVERRLGIDAPSASLALPRRLFRIVEMLTARDEAELGVIPQPGETFAQRHAFLRRALTLRLSVLAEAEDEADPVQLLSRARRTMRERETSPGLKSRLRVAADALSLNLRLGDFAFARPTMSQEEIAEHLKRLRHDRCKGSMRDTLNRLMPQPVGPRTAHVRTVESIPMHHFKGTSAQATALLRERMQQALDAIDREPGHAPKRTYRNPFFEN